MLIGGQLAATSGRFHFASRASLSTISEERTLATSGLNEQDIEIQRSSQINFIENILNDLKTNSVLLNEMLCVFRPSSSAGTFSRNVPIRFTSPQKLLHSKREDDCNNNNNNNNNQPGQYELGTGSLVKSSFICSSTNSLTSNESFRTPKDVS